MRYTLTELGQGLRRNLSMHLAVVLTLFVSLTLVGGAVVGCWGSSPPGATA